MGGGAQTRGLVRSQSNPTARKLIVRKKPAGKLLPGAHQIEREYVNPPFLFFSPPLSHIENKRGEACNSITIEQIQDKMDALFVVKDMVGDQQYLEL